MFPGWGWGRDKRTKHSPCFWKPLKDRRIALLSPTSRSRWCTSIPWLHVWGHGGLSFSVGLVTSEISVLAHQAGRSWRWQLLTLLRERPLKLSSSASIAWVLLAVWCDCGPYVCGSLSVWAAGTVAESSLEQIGLLLLQMRVNITTRSKCLIAFSHRSPTRGKRPTTLLGFWV